MANDQTNTDGDGDGDACDADDDNDGVADGADSSPLDPARCADSEPDSCDVGSGVCSYTPHEVFAELVGLVNAGQVRPLVSKTYPLTEIDVAQADFLAKKYPGKLVLIPPQN